MSLPIAAWSATYTPGTWVVLSAPRSLVVLQPAPARVSDLLNRFWQGMLTARSIEQLSALLVEHNLAELASIGLFAWGDDGVQGMVRGQLRVAELHSGKALAAGQGGPGWQPLPAADQAIRIDVEPVEQNAVLRLPLAVGAVTASSVVVAPAVEALARVVAPAAASGAVVPAAPIVADVPGAEAVAAPVPPVPPVVVPPVPPVVVPPVPSLGDSPVVTVPEFTGDLGDIEHDLMADESVPLDDVLAQPHDAIADDQASLDEPTGDILLAGDSDAVPLDQASVEQPVVSDVPGEPVPAVADDVALPPVVEGAFVPPPVVEGAFVPPPLSPHTEPMAPPPPSHAPGAGLVTATVCTLGHPNPPGSNVCRQCHGPVGSISRLVQRPTLAVVRSSFGVALDLESVILIGRAPDTQGDTSVRVLKVPSPNTDISRSHLKIRANEWQIEVTDLNSTNGSVLAVPGQPPVRMAPGQPTPVPLGTVVDLGDGVQIRIDPPR